MKTEIREGIHWVGYVDWTVRDFHGYRTERGSTYNAYLVQDEKTAVVDAVKTPYWRELVRHLQTHTELTQIDYYGHARRPQRSELIRWLGKKFTQLSNRLRGAPAVGQTTDSAADSGESAAAENEDSVQSTQLQQNGVP